MHRRRNRLSERKPRGELELARRVRGERLAERDAIDDPQQLADPVAPVDVAAAVAEQDEREAVVGHEAGVRVRAVAADADDLGA